MSESHVIDPAEPSVPLMEEAEAPLERMYIEAYLQSKGHTLHSLRDLPEGEASRLLAEASAYASAKLTEVESRAHFVEEIHGTSPGLT